MTKKGFLLALALMLTAVGGAWAQGNTTPVNPTTTPNQWSLTTPAGNVTLTVTYYGQYRLDSIPQGWQVKVNGSNWNDSLKTYTEGNPQMRYIAAINETDSVELLPPDSLKDVIKSVRLVEPVAPAPSGPTLDLATVTAATTVEDGYTVTGTLGANVKISIADGATVTIDNVTINGVNGSYKWAGITCLGDATIILSGTNTVKGFYEDYPGIHVPQNKTLTIEGSGSLTASSNDYGCGIGGGFEIACGNIVIAGGTVNATGGRNGAGIGGGGQGSSCGNITITGGTVNATGGNYAAGIGSGESGSCGTVTITDGVTSVTATKGNNAPYSIGAGDEGSCGTVTIGGQVTGDISTSPYTYTPGN